MKKKNLIVMLLLATLFLSAMPLARAATTLAPPTVSLPNNWEQTDSTPYPDTMAEHDPDGAGMLEYTDNTNYDVVRIYYEKAQVTSYSSSQLKTEAEDLFDQYDASDTRTLEASGTATFAGVEAGYAEGYDDTENTYITELVFLKGGYYFNIRAYYDATTQSEDNVTALVNSLSVSGGLGEFPWVYVVVGVVVVVVVIIIVFLMLSRKKKTPQLQQPTSYPYPPPPPSSPGP